MIVKQKGFTLIELLVVIAIIGILSSIVLVSLSDARNNAVNSVLSRNLSEIQNQTILYFGDFQNYGTAPYGRDACPTSPVANTVFANEEIIALINDTLSKTGFSASAGSRCFSVRTMWAVAFQLRGGGIAGDSVPDALCMDSRGNRKFYTYTSGQNITSILFRDFPGSAFCL